jgi:hypothetical protein
MTERIELHLLGDCFAAHRALWEATAALARKLTTATEDGYTLHLGASCMRIAAEAALQTRRPHDALRSWRECMLAERQIKLGIYLALRRNAVDNGTFDNLFALSKAAERLREEERMRLRREINHQVIV